MRNLEAVFDHDVQLNWREASLFFFKKKKTTPIFFALLETSPRHASNPLRKREGDEICHMSDKKEKLAQSASATEMQLKKSRHPLDYC